MLSPPSTSIDDDDDGYDDVECELFPSYCTTVHETIAPLKPEDVDNDMLFDQYLRSPSPSPPSSPDATSGELSGVTLVETTRDQPRGGRELDNETLQRFAPEDAQRSKIARDESGGDEWRFDQVTIRPVWRTGDLPQMTAEEEHQARLRA